MPSFADLLRVTVETDFAPLYAAMAEQADFGVADVADADRVLTRGTQSRMRRDAA